MGARRPAPGDRPIREAPFHGWLLATLGGRGRPGAALPFGDDVAAFRIGPTRLLTTTDAFSEGTHFLEDSPPRAVGRALVEANFSDLASKGGTPVGFLLSLLLPPATPERWAREVVRGVGAALAPYRLVLAGGDTKPARGRSLVGIAFGSVPPGPLPGRHRARPGDLVAVTGTVGRGGLAAWELLHRPAPRPPRLRALLDLHARVAEGRALAPRVHALLDSSDGLFGAVHLMARASRVGILLRETAIPFHPRLLVGGHDRAERLRIAGFGGDYELVAALPPRAERAARSAVAAAGGTLTVVGRVAAGRGARLEREGGRRVRLPSAGWDAFRPAPP